MLRWQRKHDRVNVVARGDLVRRDGQALLLAGKSFGAR
jgi:hypothetical protein